VARALAAVRALGDKYERIFWLRALAGYSEAEVADHLGLTLSTVKTRAHRAKLALSQRIPHAA
jgi:DNA-directed RNA polymerase specialized sigma24 family protein